MKGQNKLTINGATMCDVIRRWLDDSLSIDRPAKVLSVDERNGEFDIVFELEESGDE